ncbi:MAG: hypothetical protein Q7U83_11330, partial [Daejeonella sp.]|nr:hypothetical protein [Daejeonella sp.]
THKFQLLTKEKEAKRKSYNNNNHSFLEITNLKEGGRMYRNSTCDPFRVVKLDFWYFYKHATTFGVG